MNPISSARQTADEIVGDSLARLLADAERADQRLRAWHAAFEAALAEAELHNDDFLLTVPEVAARLACSERHVYDLIRQGTLDSVPGLGDLKRVRRSDVNRLIAGEKGAAMTAA